MSRHISTQDTDPEKPSNQDEEQARREWVSEEQWHIANATTDLSQYMRTLPPGSGIAAVNVYTPEGESVRLTAAAAT